MGGNAMSENKNCTPTKIKEAVCIDTNRVYDSCADKDCIADLRVYFTDCAQGVIENATDLRPDVLVAQMDAAALEKLGRGSVLFHFWHNELNNRNTSRPKRSGTLYISQRAIKESFWFRFFQKANGVKRGRAPEKRRFSFCQAFSFALISSKEKAKE